MKQNKAMKHTTKRKHSILNDQTHATCLKDVGLMKSDKKTRQVEKVFYRITVMTHINIIKGRGFGFVYQAKGP